MAKKANAARKTSKTAKTKAQERRLLRELEGRAATIKGGARRNSYL